MSLEMKPGKLRSLPTRKKRKGVTLIEIMISVLILGLTLLPVFDLIKMGARRVRNTQEEVTASNLATELVEQIMCMPYSLVPVVSERPLPNSDSGDKLSNDLSTIIVLSNIPDGFQRFLSIESVSTRLKKITAKVEWGNSPTRKIIHTSLMEWRP